MANELRIKRRVSGAAGAPVSLLSGELAWNMVDNVIYGGKGDDGGGNATSVIALAGNGAFVELSGDQTIAGIKTFSTVPKSSQDATATTDLVRKSQMDTLLANKSNTGHSHAISDVTNLQTSLDDKAPLDSPALTGTPTAPTPTQGDGSTKLATTAYVDSAVSSGTVTNLDDVGDVTITTVTDQELLSWDNGTSSWINRTAAEAGLAAASHSHSTADLTSGTLSVTRGGTGGSTASAARTSLGVAIGSDVQAHSAVLDGTTASFTTADETKLDYITVTQAVDLDAIETQVNGLSSAVVLKGSWDASVGTFPGAGSAQSGETRIVSVAGTVDGQEFNVNDRILSIVDNASTTTYASNWLKLDYTDEVLSVAGKTGAVTLAAADIASGTFADARISQSNVTQHQAALSLTESQISDLQAYLTDLTGESVGSLSDVTLTAPADGEILALSAGSWINRTLSEAGIAEASHTHAASDVTSGSFADARISQTSVTQHQAALSVTLSQVSDSGSMASQAASSVAITGGTIDNVTMDGGTF